MSRPCTSFGKHSAQTERIKFYGISKRNKVADIPRFGNMKFVYRNRGILVQGILCRYSGKEYESNKRIYSKLVGNRQKERSIGIVQSKRPFLKGSR